MNDLISRDMALEKMAEYVASGYADSAEDFEEYSRIICQLPPVNPQQKTGFWVGYDKNNITLWKWWDINTCSICGNGGEHYNKFRYCPNCGAKMESDHTCHTCKHYMSGEQDGSCDSYVCEHYSGWESEGEG